MKLARIRRMPPEQKIGLGLIGGGVLLFAFWHFWGGIPLVNRVRYRSRADGAHWQLIDFLDWWEGNGPFTIAVGPSGGVRTPSEQAALYAKGRTVKGEPPYTPENPLGQTVTNAATATASAHGHAAGMDLVVVDDLGRLTWDTSDADVLWKYREIGRLAKERGLDWGGDWLTRKDLPHVEVRGWASLPLATDTAVV